MVAMIRWSLVPVLALAFLPGGGDGEFEGAFETITLEDIEAHMIELASPELEGRDSPSVGLTRAADYIAAEFQAAGFQGLADFGQEPEEEEGRTFTRPNAFLLSYILDDYTVPDHKACSLSVSLEGSKPEWFDLEKDFVPLRGCSGSAEGQPVFLGFGIHAPKDRYDDLKKGKLKGKVAVILEGEPRHKRVLEGPEVTDAAQVYGKIKELEDKGIVGVLVVRRPPPEPSKRANGEELAPAGIGYRYTWARWNLPASPKPHKREFRIPVLEISSAAAQRILGEDVNALGAKIDKSGKPVRHEAKNATVSLSAEFKTDAVELFNVAGVLEGSDPDLAGEYVVLGAHYDHIGVDQRGRIGFGADDNASGTSALIELAQAFGTSPPRRSVIVVAFSAEEDGLLGSKRFAEKPPVPQESLVAMLNMDMLGRGATNEVVVGGTKQNPDLEKKLKEAKKLSPTKVKKVITGKAQHLWERSDQFSFHEVGIPSLFFFEAVSETENEDYHTYRDTIESVDMEKITRSTRFIFNTAWLIANDDERPSPPR
jgi:hypothetical protein